jgi:hypothetical protein
MRGRITGSRAGEKSDVPFSSPRKGFATAKGVAGAAIWTLPFIIADWGARELDGASDKMEDEMDRTSRLEQEIAALERAKRESTVDSRCPDLEGFEF